MAKRRKARKSSKRKLKVGQCKKVGKVLLCMTRKGPRFRAK